jgi:hypothetical protein
VASAVLLSLAHSVEAPAALVTVSQMNHKTLEFQFHASLLRDQNGWLWVLSPQPTRTESREPMAAGLCRGWRMV